MRRFEKQRRLSEGEWLIKIKSRELSSKTLRDSRMPRKVNLFNCPTANL